MKSLERLLRSSLNEVKSGVTVVQERKMIPLHFNRRTIAFVINLLKIAELDDTIGSILASIYSVYILA